MCMEIEKIIFSWHVAWRTFIHNVLIENGQSDTVIRILVIHNFHVPITSTIIGKERAS